MKLLFKSVFIISLFLSLPSFAIDKLTEENIRAFFNTMQIATKNKDIDKFFYSFSTDSTFLFENISQNKKYTISLNFQDYKKHQLEIHNIASKHDVDLKITEINLKDNDTSATILLELHQTVHIKQFEIISQGKNFEVHIEIRDDLIKIIRMQGTVNILIHELVVL